MNKRTKMLMLAVSSAVMIAGCTKSNIVKPDEAVLEPDFNKYNNLEIDVDQLHDDVDEIYLDPQDYPMAVAIDFDINQDEEYVDVTAVVKDDTTPEDAAYFAEVAIKGIATEYAMQDFTYGEAEEDSFGGLYQNNDINLKVYTESEYEADGEPMYETTIPMDTYEKIVIE